MVELVFEVGKVNSTKRKGKRTSRRTRKSGEWGLSLGGRSSSAVLTAPDYDTWRRRLKIQVLSEGGGREF